MKGGKQNVSGRRKRETPPGVSLMLQVEGNAAGLIT